MYEQYTDKQIVEMLVPKLEKLCPYYDWNDYLNSEGYEAWLHFVATLYKSGYIRGQKGRSFLIGEKKAEVNGTKGNKVCWFSDDRSEYYPSVVGTIGTISWVDEDGDLWVDWPFESCEANRIGNHIWCCAKNQCLLIDTNVKGNIKKGDKIVYLGTKGGFFCNDVWPDRVATGVVDIAEKESGCFVYWDNPVVVADHYHGHTHVWYEDIAKVIPWD